MACTRFRRKLYRFRRMKSIMLTKRSRSLEQSGIRVDVDIREEKLGYKIREAQLEKAPYMFIIGENERNSGAISVRKRGEGDLGVQSIDGTVEMLREEIQAKR